MKKIDAKNNGDRIDISVDSFDHLLNCLDNQKFNPCKDAQESIDGFNSQCREVLHTKHREDYTQPSYWKHFKLNMHVTCRCMILGIFHFIHAVIPCDYTSHEYWRI